MLETDAFTGTARMPCADAARAAHAAVVRTGAQTTADNAIAGGPATVHRSLPAFHRRATRPARQAGATVVEFALIATVFFSVLIAIADFGQLFWTNLTMQHAVREGARYAVTGNASLAPTPAAADARCQATIAKIREQSMGNFDRVQARVQFKTVANNPAANVAPIAIGSCFNAGEIIVVQVDARAQVISPFLRPLFTDGVYAFSVSTTMKNEAFE